MTVYLIEDDEAVRQSIGAVLETHGATVRPLSGAGEARRLRYHEDRAIMVIDVHLTDGLGPDLLAELRSNGVSAPAILMTGRIEARLRNIARDLEVAILEKPLDGDDLAARMSSLMHGNH